MVQSSCPIRSAHAPGRPGDTARRPIPAPNVAPVLTSADARDVHSYAQPLEARVTHVSLNLYADFDTHVMRGIATLSVDAKPDAKRLVVDDNGLRIVTVTDAQNRPCSTRSARSTRCTARR
ncbi:hypothetical protein GCM10020258_25690 [Sphingomonas yabuuchiae]